VFDERILIITSPLIVLKEVVIGRQGL
jgi:hypothetical protein